MVELRPVGLNRYEAVLTFGNFARETIDQMRRADEEEILLARALVASIGGSAEITFSDGQTLADWIIGSDRFFIRALKRGIENRFDDEALVMVCKELVTPLLAAMAELYGYDPVEEAHSPETLAHMEGAIKLETVRRRERNPRNRLLCFRLGFHGDHCIICGVHPREIYGEAGTILEVHHLQPLSLSEGGRPYDPSSDLIPLCPNCHRAVHTKAPVPLSPEELRQRMKRHE